MANLNKVMIIGNVGTDPEMRFTPNGNPVTTFRIATSRIFTSSEGERKQETEWFTVVTWNKLAESCNQFLTKGRRAYVEGKLRTRFWEGQDGQRRTRVEVVADRVILIARYLGGGDSEDSSTQTKEPSSNDTPASDETINPDDLPF